jgi:hypothetical protein
MNSGAFAAGSATRELGQSMVRGRTALGGARVADIAGMHVGEQTSRDGAATPGDGCATAVT